MFGWLDGVKQLVVQLWGEDLLLQTSLCISRMQSLFTFTMILSNKCSKDQYPRLSCKSMVRNTVSPHNFMENVLLLFIRHSTASLKVKVKWKFHTASDSSRQEMAQEVPCIVYINGTFAANFLWINNVSGLADQRSKWTLILGCRSDVKKQTGRQKKIMISVETWDTGLLFNLSRVLYIPH